MKITFDRAAMQEALGYAQAVIPSRTPKAILQCVHLNAEGDALYVSATDTEIGVQVKADKAVIDKEGQAVLPCDKLAAIVRESGDETMTLETADTTAQIVGSDSRFTLYTHDIDQYPRVAGFSAGAALTVKMDDLKSAIDMTVFATAKESTRYALNGVLMEFPPKSLSLVGTDGRRLAKAVIPVQMQGEKPAERLIAPAKTMHMLAKLPCDGQTAAIRFVGNQMILQTDSIVICSNLIDGHFPKYEDIIPKDYQNRAVCSTQAMLSAVRRTALLATEDSRGVRFKLEKTKLVLTSRSPEAGDAQIEMPIEYNGAPMEIGFNPQFLIDALRAVKAADIELWLGQPDRPGMLRCGADFLYIIMPVSL